MGRWFVPLLALSVLIGWTLGISGCRGAAEQGWIPVPRPEAPVHALSADGMRGVTVDGTMMPAAMVSGPAPGDMDAGGVGADGGSVADPDAVAPDAAVVVVAPIGDAFHVCGNGVLEAGEDCDDGNLDDGDGCSRGCAVE